MRTLLPYAALWLVSSTLSLAGCTRKTADSERTNVVIEVWTSHQEIDGFGTTAPAVGGDDPKVASLLFDDLGATVLRGDLTPAFAAPVSDFQYNSPWFHGSPALPGPEGNNVRTYRDASDYGRKWGERRAEIAVMGPNVERNITKLSFDTESIRSFGVLARAGASKVKGFRLIGSLWSPAPWLKQRHGSNIGPGDGIMPRAGTPWPFLWGGNFAGGKLDTSDEPRAEFDDRAEGGSGKTSALTQFTRTLTAYLLGFQRRFDVRFYAISLQNELNFETFYNSCSYPDAADYLKVLKATRRALDRHEALRDIRIMGPEDLLGSDAFGLWQFGAGADAVHKNLRYLAALARDREALAALSFFAIHGYAPDGVKSVGADPKTWRYWARGWETAPAAGLPHRVRGFTMFGKKSWMTETSGEPSAWLPEDGSDLDASALGLALKIHQALTVGQESAWLYWQLLDGHPVSKNSLTDLTLGSGAPKYAAAKHYFRHVRPGARRIGVRVDGNDVHATAFAHRDDRTVTVIIVHTGKKPRPIALAGPKIGHRIEVLVSDRTALFQHVATKRVAQRTELTLPAESVTTLVIRPSDT